MVVDTEAETGVESSREVVAAVDRTGPYPEYVIADISRDGAWIAVRESESLPLAAWQ